LTPKHIQFDTSPNTYSKIIVLILFCFFKKIDVLFLATVPQQQYQSTTQLNDQGIMYESLPQKNNLNQYDAVDAPF